MMKPYMAYLAFPLKIVVIIAAFYASVYMGTEDYWIPLTFTCGLLAGYQIRIIDQAVEG